MVYFLIRESERSSRASAIILNTFDDFEHSVIDGMISLLPPVYSIGPLQLLSGQIPKSSDVVSMGSNLWKEDTDCLKLLDKRAQDSVVYVNFGGITVMKNHQMVEFAWGLCNSNKHFLWIIRPDLVRGDTAVMPEEFLKKTKERGLMTSWCPQEQVLGHSAIGGFLTHCGWNSILESISGGDPMLCWPFFAEQQTNCRNSILELMDGDKGREMRSRAWGLKVKTIAATVEGGSSLVNLENLVSYLLT